MFENEVAICITTADGNIISFFMPADFVNSFSGKSEIRVELVEQLGDFGVVSLPRRTLEGPSVARVPALALRYA